MLHNENIVIYAGHTALSELWHLKGYNCLGMLLAYQRQGMHAEFWSISLLESDHLEHWEGDGL
jgi:hypothetical protein